MIGTGKGSITKTIRLSTIHDLPNVIGGGKGDVRAVARYEPFPILLENPLERKMAFSDSFHDELNFTSVPDDATNCPVRGIMFMYRKNKNSEGLSKQGNRLSNEGDYYQQRKTEAGN